MIDFNECLAKGLLARIPASKEKAVQSIEKAKELLEEAKANLEEERINSTVIVAYLAIFHAARASTTGLLSQPWQKKTLKNSLNGINKIKIFTHWSWLL